MGQRHPCDALPESGVAVERIGVGGMVEALAESLGVDAATDGAPLAVSLTTPRGRVELRAPALLGAG